VKTTGRNRISALVFLGISLAICLGSIKLSLGSFHKPGSGFFPLLTGAFLGICSMMVLLKSYKKSDVSEKRGSFLDKRGLLKICYVILALFLYTIGMNYLGFVLSTMLFLGFLLRCIDPKPWSMVISISIVATAASYWLFKIWLDVQFPTGIIGF
jgi:putative tricarboxylic transport membrane protein